MSPPEQQATAAIEKNGGNVINKQEKFETV
jgi:hypothetical protein